MKFSASAAAIFFVASSANMQTASASFLRRGNNNNDDSDKAAATPMILTTKSTGATIGARSVSMDEQRRRHFFSSDPQPGMRVNKIRYWNGAFGGLTLENCEEVCRNDNDCQSFTFEHDVQGTSDACYISFDSDLIPCKANDTLCGPNFRSYTFNKFNGLRKVEGGNIEIGPGSYYRNDPEITVFYQTNDVEQAWGWAQTFDSTNNPVVMFQMFDGYAMAHRLRFMSQNLDSQTGYSPVAWASSTADWNRGSNQPGYDVYVRSEEWYGINRVDGNGDVAPQQPQPPQRPPKVPDVPDANPSPPINNAGGTCGNDIWQLSAALGDAVNAYRRERGLKPFAIDNRVVHAAQVHVIDQGNGGIQEPPSDPNGCNPHSWHGDGSIYEGCCVSDRFPNNNCGYDQVRAITAACGDIFPGGAGEISTWWETEDATALVEQWKRSPGHHAAMLSTEYNVIGCGARAQVYEFIPWYPAGHAPTSLVAAHCLLGTL